MSWVAVGAGVGTFAAGMMNGGGGGGGGGGQQYVPGHLASADDNWQNSNQNSYNLADAAYTVGVPNYNQSFDRANGLDWSPYLQSAGQSGSAYGRTAGAAMQQVDQYGQMADRAAGQQAAMYGAGDQVMQTAFDPQNQLYDRTAQRVQDQVRAGQAARGLGNSEAGLMEEAGAMSNFNIDWQNAQLARQATGIQAGSQASGAGAQQGQLYGADQSAALTAGAAGAGYYQQAGQVPMSMQQQWAAAPGQAAAQLQGGYANLQQGFGAVQSQAIPYMNAGNGAIQQNWQNNYTQNRDMVSGMSQMAGAVGPQVASWFNNSGSASQPNAAWSQNWNAGMNGSYGDVAYG